MFSTLSLFLFLCKFLTLVSGYIVESLIKFFCCQNKKASLYLLCYKMSMLIWLCVTSLTNKIMFCTRRKWHLWRRTEWLKDQFFKLKFCWFVTLKETTVDCFVFGGSNFACFKAFFIYIPKIFITSFTSHMLLWTLWISCRVGTYHHQTIILWHWKSVVCSSSIKWFIWELEPSQINSKSS